MLKCILFNAQSIVNKLPELQYVMYNSSYECIFVTETWLHSDVCDGVIDPRGWYCVFRKDRVGVRGGGVCMLVRKKFKVIPISFNDLYSNVEIVGVTFLEFQPKLDVFVVYRPPKRDDDARQYVQLLVECLLSCEVIHHTRLIVGDFNLPNIDWTTLSGSNDRVDNLFIDFVVQNALSQVVDFPTRYSSVLDLVFTNTEQVVVSVCPHDPVGRSDHNAVELSLGLARNRNCNGNPAVLPTNNCKIAWHRANYDVFSEYLSSINWFDVVCQYPDVSQLYRIFSESVTNAVSLATPVLSQRRNRDRPLYPREVRRYALLKRKLWKNLSERPWDSLLRQKYRDCVHRYCCAIRRHHISVEDELITSNDLGAFYRYINRRITNRSSIGVIVDNGNVLTDDLHKANAFNCHFASVSIMDNGIIPKCPDVQLISILDEITVDEAEVLNSINKLKCNLSGGPDGFPPIMFKRAKHCLAVPLTLIYNQMLSVAYVPPVWLSAQIVPVYKKGVTGDLNNYRPISLTCVVSKILERIIVSRILEHFTQNHILHPAQHGFVRKRSTCTNLLECCNDWSLRVQNKQQVSIVYIDFTKAFDVVSHEKLFARLYSYGIRGNLLLFLKKFFSGRCHQTKVGCCLSDVAMLLSGVVQGSGIGPCMFLTYINDLLQELERHNVTVKAFADDVKMYLEIVDDLDTDRLQHVVDVLCKWANEWQLGISVSKCCVLNIGKSVTNVSVRINDCVLPVVKHVRDLGVLISSDLSSSLHVTDVVSRAHKRAAAILRSFVARDVQLLVRAFITYVRPIVEYNTVVWSPYTVQDVTSVESVQRRFTKRLPGLNTLSYAERLKMLNITSLELRRVRADLYWAYKIIFGLCDVRCDEFFSLSHCKTTRGHKYKLYKYHNSTNVRAKFFTERVTNYWNELPDTTDFTSFASFKRCVKKVKFANLKFGVGVDV